MGRDNRYRIVLSVHYSYKPPWLQTGR